MNILRSGGHEIYGMHVNKISLSPFDSKRWMDEDSIHTKAYGYALPTFTDEELAGLSKSLGKDVYTDEKLLELLGW